MDTDHTHTKQNGVRLENCILLRKKKGKEGRPPREKEGHGGGEDSRGIERTKLESEEKQSVSSGIKR